jgi:hypothetical protein
MYEPDEQKGLEWEKKGLAFQIVDVAVEIALVGVGAFWLVYFINTSAPIIPIRHGLEDFVDSYTSGVFFMFSVFIFMSGLTHKLKYLFRIILGELFDHYFPEQGSILDGTLTYSQRQKERFRGRA